MRIGIRSIVLLLALTMSAAACSDDGASTTGDAGTSTPVLVDEPVEEQLAVEPEQSGETGRVADALSEAGLPDEQVDCLAELITIEDLIAAGGAANGERPAAFTEALDECGVGVDEPAGSDG